MTKRRTYRRRHYAPPEVSSPFSVDRILSLTATPAIAGLVAMVGFYFTVNATLQRQGDEQKTTAARVEAVTKLVEQKKTDDDASREKIREAFLASQTKTNDGIAKLDVRLAIAETNQKVANDELKKIADSLAKISSFTQPAIAGGRR